MKVWRLPLLLVLCVVAFHGHCSSTQLFLRLDGITGSSTDTNHAGWMDITSLAWGAGLQAGSVTNGGQAGSSFAVSQIAIAKPMDTASPQLALQAAGGATAIGTGTLDFIRTDASQERCLRINLTNILLSAYQVSAFGNPPGEAVTLSPLQLSWNYTYYNISNGLPAYRFNKWDLVSRTGESGVNQPSFASAGVRVANGVELDWRAVAGRKYRIFAVPDLKQPFRPAAEFTATTDGVTNYVLTSASPAMFYVVEEVPAGY